MSKNGYNQLLESKEEVKSNNNNTNFPIKGNINYTQYNLNGSNNFNLGNQNETFMDNNYGFKTNNFQRNNQRIPINWRNVRKVDIDAIRNTNDLSVLNSYLENFLYSTITDYDIQAVEEANVVKLIKILQFSNEFLLNSRQNLNEKIINLEGQKQILINQNQKLDEILENQKDYIDKAKKEKFKRLKDIADYKNIILSLVKDGIPVQGYGGTTKITDINVDINNRYNYNKTNLRGGPTNGYKCKFCLGKIFPSQFELKKHLKDIHLIDEFPEEQQYNKSQNYRQQIAPKTEIKIVPPPELINNNNLRNNNNNRNIYEDKLNEIKMELQEYRHKFEIDSLKNQLNKKNDEKNNEIEQQIKKMGNTFNDTLKEMKDILRNKMNNKQKKKKIKKINNYNYENDLRNDKDINYLEKLINEKKNILNLNKKEYEEKITLLTKEIININLNKKIIPNKPKTYVLEQNEQISYSNKKEKKPGKRTKYHSGLIESDHDDTEKENNRKEKIIRELKDKTKLIQIITNVPKNDSEEDSDIDIQLRNINIKDSKKEKLEELEHFYKKYIKRDNKYLKKPEMDLYLNEVLPNKFSDNSQIKKNAKYDNNKKIERVVNYFNDDNQIEISPKYQIDELKEKEKEELCKIIDSNYDLMEKYNKDEKYYNSVKELIDLEDLRKIIKKNIKIDEKKYNLYNKINNENNEKVKYDRLRAINNKRKEDQNNIIINEEESPYFNSGDLFGTKNENDIKLKTQNQNQIINSVTNINNTGNINNLQNTNYSIGTNGSFPKNTINQQPLYNNDLDSQYTSSKHGIEQNNIKNATILKEGQKQKSPNVPYSSATEGQGQLRNNQKSPNVPFSSETEGQGQLRNNQNAPNVPYSSTREGQGQN